MYLISLENGIIKGCVKVENKQEAEWRFPADFLKKCVYSDCHLPVGQRYFNGAARPIEVEEQSVEVEQ